MINVYHKTLWLDIMKVHEFPGRRQRETLVLNAKGVVKLLMWIREITFERFENCIKEDFVFLYVQHIF